MTNNYTKAAALGIVCGMRTMLGPAFAARTASPKIRLLFTILSVGELIADKLPTTPSRLAPGPLFGRLASGALVGYSVCRESGESRWLGSLCGMAGALAGAYGGYYGRKALGESLHVPDPAIALLEDTIAGGIGRRFAL